MVTLIWTLKKKTKSHLKFWGCIVIFNHPVYLIGSLTHRIQNLWGEKTQWTKWYFCELHILDYAHHGKSRHHENGSDMKIKDFTPNKYEINKIYSHSRSNRDLKQHTKLIKTICKCILDGRIPLESPHIAKLKPHRKFIRNVAHDNLNLAKKHIQTGGSILQTVLKTVLPILSELLL